MASAKHWALLLLCIVLASECISVFAVTTSMKTKRSRTRSRRALDSIQMSAHAARRKKGFLKSAGSFLGKMAMGALTNKLGLATKVSPSVAAQQKAQLLQLQVIGVVSRIPRTDSQCVICQFVVQRVRAEILLNGIGGSVPFGLSPDTHSRLSANAGANAGSSGSASGGGSSSAGSAESSSFLEEDYISTHDSSVLASRVASSSLLERGQSLNTRNQRGPWNTMKKIGGAILGGVKRVLGAAARPAPLGSPVPVNFPKPPNWERYEIPVSAQRTTPRWITKRERDQDGFIYQPTQARYADSSTGPLNSEMFAQERYENNQLYSTVYQVVEETCTKRMPKPFFAFCGDLLRKYQALGNALRWRDRPDAVCMALNFCGVTSYTQSGPHSAYRDYS